MVIGLSFYLYYLHHIEMKISPQNLFFRPIMISCHNNSRINTNYYLMDALSLCPQYSKTLVTGPVKRYTNSATSRILRLQSDYCLQEPQSEENICQHGTEFTNCANDAV